MAQSKGSAARFSGIDVAALVSVWENLNQNLLRRMVAMASLSRVRSRGAKKAYSGWRIQFMDKARNILYEYNPDRHRHEVTVHELASNEELIGVYGVKDK